MKILEQLGALDDALKKVRSIWESIPVPSPYREALISWTTMEMIAAWLISILLENHRLVTFLGTSIVLLLLSLAALLRSIKVAKRSRTDLVANLRKCRQHDCKKAVDLLGFCAQHALAARKCFKLFETYTEGDHKCFFGRGIATSDLWKAVQQPLTLLIGDSGIGKSSLIQAGLNPLLKSQKPSLSALYINCRDIKADPQGHLSVRLDKLLLECRTSVLVELDQFEQLLARFPNSIPNLIDFMVQRMRGGTVRFLLSMRREYVDDIDQWEKSFGDFSILNRVRLRRMSEDEALEVLTGSAQFAGIDMPDDLKNALLEDLCKASGAMEDPTRRISPAELQIVCTQLLGGVGTITIADYRARGGRLGILEEFLRDILEQFPKRQRDHAMHLLFELARHTAPISKRLSLQELSPANASTESTRDILSKLVRFQLVNHHPGTQDAPDAGTQTNLKPTNPDTWDLSHEYLAPMIRRRIRASEVPQYRARLDFDRLVHDFSESRTPQLLRLWSVFRLLRHTDWPAKEREVFNAMFWRAVVRHGLPTLLAVSLLGAGLGAITYKLNATRYLAFHPRGAVLVTSESKSLLGLDDEITYPRLPIMLFRGHPWAHTLSRIGFDTGYYADQLDPAGFQLLPEGIVVDSDERRWLEKLIPLMNDPGDRAEALLITQGGAAAITYIKNFLEIENDETRRLSAFKALANIPDPQAEALLLAKLEATGNKNESASILRVLVQSPTVQHPSLLAKALTSERVALEHRTKFLLNLKAANVPALVAPLQKVVGAQQEPISSIANLWLCAVGDQCDLVKVSQLREGIDARGNVDFLKLSNEGFLHFDRSDLLKIADLLLCSRSLQHCLDHSRSLLDSRPRWEREDMTSHSSRLIDSIRKALGEKDVLDWLFSQLASHNSSQNERAAQLLLFVEGPEVSRRVLDHLQRGALIPHLSKALLRASPEELTPHQAALEGLVVNGNIPKRSRVHAALALLKSGSNTRLSYLEQIIRSPPARDDKDLLVPNPELEAITEAVSQAPQYYGALKEAVAWQATTYSDWKYTFLPLSVALGKKALIADMATTLVSDGHMDDKEEDGRFLSTLFRSIDSKELHEKLEKLAASPSAVERLNVATIYGWLDRQDKMAQLTQMAQDPDNYNAPYSNKSVLDKAIASLVIEDKPDASLLAFLNVAGSAIPTTRRAALMGIEPFVKLATRAPASTLAKIREELSSRHEDTRLVSLTLLAAAAEMDDLDRIRAMAETEDSFAVRRLAAKLYAKNPRAKLETLALLLTHPAWAVRSGAAEALEELADASKLEKLRPQIETASPLLVERLLRQASRGISQRQNQPLPGTPACAFTELKP